MVPTYNRRERLLRAVRGIDLVELSVGVDLYLGRVKLVITGVEAQAESTASADADMTLVGRVGFEPT